MDYWSLGILIFELLARKTPFRQKDDLKIYESALRGIHRLVTFYDSHIMNHTIKCTNSFLYISKSWNIDKTAMPNRSIWAYWLSKRWYLWHTKTPMVSRFQLGSSQKSSFSFGFSKSFSFGKILWKNHIFEYSKIDLLEPDISGSNNSWHQNFVRHIKLWTDYNFGWRFYSRRDFKLGSIFLNP